MICASLCSTVKVRWAFGSMLLLNHKNRKGRFWEKKECIQHTQGFSREDFLLEPVVVAAIAVAVEVAVAIGWRWQSVAVCSVAGGIWWQWQWR